jgi:hypothetical protein
MTLSIPLEKNYYEKSNWHLPLIKHEEILPEGERFMYITEHTLSDKVKNILLYSEKNQKETKISELRGKFISSLNNEQIDTMAKNIREEWERDIL